MKTVLVAVLLILVPACELPLTFTVHVPCSASLVRDTTAAADTVLRWQADSLGCPRRER